MKMFYFKTAIDSHKKYKFKKIDCASYSAFVSTFSQYMNPKNKTVLIFGCATINKCSNKKKIGELSDHFWVKINNQLFDNSNVYTDYSYTKHNPILATEDILSGQFKFRQITKTSPTKVAEI
jgi:hypothetical protein